MGFEAHRQLLALGEKPTHIFLQAGVGSLAASITGFFAGVYGEERPIITIVEPNKADCVYKTAEANDGKLRFVTGDMDTLMAGLACGEPCTIGWNILSDYADNFISCPDYLAAKGMRILGNPCHGDVRVESGESGAVTLGLVAELMQNPEYRAAKEALSLDADSRVLCFSTEGATDWESYKSIVWEGAYAGAR
jgi:diaminopropionate ammonia-lyase